MKFVSTVALAGLLPAASAHYFFDKLIINGKETNSGQYVRTSTRPTKYNPIKWENVRDNSTPDLDDIICNQGAFSSAGRTQVAEIPAGTKIGFKLAVGATMQHPGPGFGYMSKAPGSVKEYRGDGDWFKIFEEGVCRQNADFTRDAWCTWDRNYIEFTIPKDTPDGEYLVRVEHIGIHGAHVHQAEFYPACAQIKVTGGGNGTPGPFIRWPGGYKKTDPSFNYSIYGGYKPYPMPGPPVWTGGNSGTSPAPPPASSSRPSNPPPASTSKPPTAATSVAPANPPPAASSAPVNPPPVASSAPANPPPVATPSPANPPAATSAAPSTPVPTAPPAEEEEEEEEEGECEAEEEEPECSGLYGQCGGCGYTGPKCCSKGSCQVANEWYSQCL